MRIAKRVLALVLIFCLLLFIPPIKADAKRNSFTYDYGVFLSVNAGKSAMKKFAPYETIVIDVQNDFSKSDIKKLKKQGHKIFSYINVGAIENYRDYYKSYAALTLDVYENWPDEKWVDVSSKKWQDFILKKLSTRIINTGVDGFFVDNIDVYYHYHNKKIYSGVETILKGLKKKGKVIVNGGDTFVSEYYKKNGSLNKILDAVNQETVFSRIIDYDKDRFGKNTSSETKYFKKYLSTVNRANKTCYLLEYTKSKTLGKEIKKYCKKKGYKYYISKKLDLS